MQIANLNELELRELWSDEDPSQRTRVTFPDFHATGAKSTATVYYELEPGDRIGTHTDSAEEILYIVEGRGEATVGEERAPVEAGMLAVVPALVPHAVANTGDTVLKVLGFFSSNTLLSVFENAWQPEGVRVVGTPLPEEAAVGA